MPSRLNPKQRARVIASMTSDSEWNYLALPLKKYGEHMEFAVLLDPVPTPQSPITFYEGNVHGGITKGGKQWSYDNVEAAIDAGWEVD